jgi:ferredoxin
MCATVCPSNAIVFKPREELLEERREVPVNIFQFGEQTVKTKVNIMVPVGVREIELDVAALIATPEPESCSTDPLEMEST